MLNLPALGKPKARPGFQHLYIVKSMSTSARHTRNGFRLRMRESVSWCIYQNAEWLVIVASQSQLQRPASESQDNECAGRIQPEEHAAAGDRQGFRSQYCRFADLDDGEV